MYKDILVYLDPSPDAEVRLKVATALARPHEARLTGLDATAADAFKGEWLDRAARLPDMFNEEVRLSGVEGRYVGIDRWVGAGGHEYAHYVDLIIASQPEFETRRLIVPGVPEDVLLKAGVPMLLLPSGWAKRPIGDHVLIAWKSSREAVRAVHDAMPFLTRARTVTAFTFGPRPDGAGEEPASLIDHLKRHGVKAEPSRWPAVNDGMTPVDALFASLDVQDADLIVAGGFSHARWAEDLFGGVTRDLVRQPSLPILLSH
jgi:nucleotide-binding universal stress UspA family protein